MFNFYFHHARRDSFGILLLVFYCSRLLKKGHITAFVHAYYATTFQMGFSIFLGDFYGKSYGNFAASFKTKKLNIVFLKFGSVSTQCMLFDVCNLHKYKMGIILNINISVYVED